MARSYNVVVVVVYAMVMMVSVGVIMCRGGDPCVGGMSNTMGKLMSCLPATKSLKGRVAPACCAEVAQLSKQPACLCAIMNSPQVKAAGANPKIAQSIPPRCGIKGTPLTGYKCPAIYPSTFEEWQTVESISGKIIVYHTEIGSILHNGKLPSALASEGIFFYDSLYVLPFGNRQYGKLQPLPPPALNSVEWPCTNPDMATSYKLRFVSDIQNAMKPSTGAKGVHLSWLLPVSCFASFFASCTGIRKTKFTYTCKDLEQEWLDSTLGPNWDTKTTYGKETVQCIVTAQDVVFRYFIARQALCMRYTYKRWRLVRGDWLQMDQDLRDENISVSVDITILWCGHAPITTNVQSNWPLQFLRQEIVLLCVDHPANFYFRLDGRKIRNRRETEMKCGECVSPHVVELIES